MKYGTFEADGWKFDIAITGDGKFTTTADGESYTADTYEKLKTKIVRACRREKVRLALPATVAKQSSRFGDETQRIFDVVVTGIHQRSHDVLYRNELDHKAGSIENYGDHLMVRLTMEQRDKYLELQKAKKDATAAFEAFQKKYKYSVDDIKKQVATAEKAAGITPEEE
jgi:hypothetical protein